MTGSKLYVGTSGFSFPDWKGTFYPAGLPEKEQLPFYASRFNALEVNFTYYRIPGPKQLAGMDDRSGGRLTFTVKANREMTHTGKAAARDWAAFREALDPLADAGRLGAVLAQFPWAFRPSEESRRAIGKIEENLRPFPLVVEFRHASWASEKTVDFLRELRTGFCAVDEPRLKGLFPAMTAVTSPVAYVRFHGRNAARWWRHKEAHERYDYLYTAAQLEEWVPRIGKMAAEADRVFLFMNNHYEGKAAINAEMLSDML